MGWLDACSLGGLERRAVFTEQAVLACGVGALAQLIKLNEEVMD